MAQPQGPSSDWETRNPTRGLGLYLSRYFQKYAWKVIWLIFSTRKSQQELVKLNAKWENKYMRCFPRPLSAPAESGAWLSTWRAKELAKDMAPCEEMNEGGVSRRIGATVRPGSCCSQGGWASDRVPRQAGENKTGASPATPQCDRNSVPCSPLQGWGVLPSADDPPAGTRHSPRVLAVL